MFSFDDYRQIIKSIQAHIPIMRFDDVTNATPSYCVIRHDVEFSIERAYQLALVEHELGISSTYVFQICNNNYNPFSYKNKKLIHKIYELGH